MARWTLLLSMLGFSGSPLLGVAGDESLSFDRDVRPILAAHCYECHGPDANHRKAGLRLDLSEGVREERRHGFAVVPGEPERSLLIQRVESNDPKQVMPPSDLKDSLDEHEKDLLRRWVAAGAEYESHWAFGAPTTPALPEVSRADWARETLDQFVLADLERRGLTPSPEADQRTLIRRVSLTLCGLPPAPEEVDAFLADTRPDAYEHLVDRLLATEDYAERMTLAWMDAARYGDTSVFHADGPRDMWPWRNWVIEAYRDNMPFDQFTVEQLAGDLLPESNQRQKVATGFHRNHGTTDEGGVIDEEYRVEYMVDRVKTTGNVWLGLTMECAQCHDHKYDPVSQREYYQVYAFFNQSQDAGMQTRNGNAQPLISAPTEAQVESDTRLSSALSTAQSALAATRPPAEELTTWISAEREALLAMDAPVGEPWQVLGPFVVGNRGELFKTLHVDPAAIDLDAEVEGKKWAAREDLVDGKAHGLGLPGESSIYLLRSLTVQRAGPRAFSFGSDDTIQVWLNGQLVLAKEVFRGVAPDQDKIEVELKEGRNELLLKVSNGGGASGFYYKGLGSSLPDAVEAALRADDCGPDTEHRRTLEEYYVRNRWETGVALFADVQKIEKELADLRAKTPTVMVLADRPDGRKTYILDRGMYDAPRTDEVIEPGTPAFLPPMAEDLPRNRLGLARWIVDPAHPLTARVAVNRYWALIFGHGLIDTVMDFGVQGERPSHPELLDWLALDFVESGWNVKRMLRQLLTSATFRQSSTGRPELSEDRHNRWLGRGTRMRLQGEFVRDQALAVSGLLVDEVGGPSVKPYQPPGLWNDVSLNGGLRFQRDSGDKLYRKSMYIYWKRSAPMPVMTIFDAPTREKCVVQRLLTNTPLQALVTLNDVQFVEAARQLAQRLMKEGGEDFDARLERGFLLCTSRPPDALRQQVFREVYEAQIAAYRAAPEEAVRLLSNGESARDETLDAAEHATWTILASLLLNLDETLNRE